MRKKLTGFAWVLAAVLSTPVIADEYSEAYTCGLEAFTEGASGPVSYCVGNSYDPSTLQMKAFADAERDFKAGNLNVSSQCPFEFAVWMANGSRSDGFEEGAQLLATLTDVANLLSVSRDVFLYDINGNRITASVANQWFAQQDGSVVVSQEAAQQCPDKIN
ncbi:hypothetical protein ACS8E9_05410 [Pseudomonas neustonica]|uniref:hypothetical protein n=1 Tax=Pseudomonas TaxID=286 RepID=UPI0015F411C6|nr:hypothetical protein [Pseudomonas sp. 5Ae-yellow]MBA6421185.1 hypothetical protein [Pseudomonas sp. 5Ae-yellow]|tara:strand:- start:1319 stop:1804 length:486 start_codon:yes stop_codon:yes gene_type:complete